MMPSTTVTDSVTDPFAIDATTMPGRERWRRALSALATVMADPDRTDQVLVFSIYANAGSLPSRIHRFLDDPTGRRLFEERRYLDSRTIDLDALAALPTNTLGHAYATFMRANGLTPDVFDAPPEQVRDEQMTYVVQRLRQTHDLWHVVTGFQTTPTSEIALQAFTFGHLGAPSSAVLALAGTLRAARVMPTLFLEVARAFRAGRRADRLATFAWEDHWETPLDEVRALLDISPAFVAAAHRAIGPVGDDAFARRPTAMA